MGSTKSGAALAWTLLLAGVTAACHQGRRGGVETVSVAVTPIVSVIARGTSVQFVAMAILGDGSTRGITDSAGWRSSQPSVATVGTGPGTGGLAAALQVGLTTITATDPSNGVRGSATLRVTAAALVSIEVTPTNPSAALGTTRQFTAMGTFTDNSVQDLTGQVDWGSSDIGVATIGNTAGSRGLATGVAVGATTITATDPGTAVVGTTTLSVTSAALLFIALTPVVPSVPLGLAQQFTATGTFSDSSVQDLTTLVTWSSSNTATATISNVPGSNGLATGTGIGTATIFATHPGSGLFAGTTMTVTSAVLVSVAVTPANPSIPLGLTQQFTATGIYSDSTVQDLTTGATWSSSDAGVAAVSNAAGSRGLATSVAIGGTTITATDPGSAVSGSTTLTVTAAAIVSIAVTPANPSIPLGLTQQFTATGTFTDSSVQDLTTSVTWSSSNTGVAAISNAAGSRGLATSVAVGGTTITATDPGSAVAGNTTLTVTAAVLVSVAVTPANPALPLGLTQQFTATGTFTDSSVQDLTTSVTWGSSDTGTATISNAAGSRGLATSAAVGGTTITATDPGSGIFGSTTLTVTTAVLVSIAVTPANPSIPLGLAQQFTATGTFTDSSVQDLTTSVTWSSSNTGTATISNAAGSRGLASSVAVGSTTITATDPGSSVAGGTTLTVTAAVLVSIAVTPASPSLPLGLAQQFTATGTFTDSSVQDLTTSVTWSSGNTATATISNAAGSRALATSAAVGSTTITATDPGSGIFGSTTLTVTGAALVSIAVTPANPSIPLGLTQQFTAIGTFTDSSVQDLTTSVTWSSSATGTATISNAAGSRGFATSVAVGSTTITATDPGSGIFGSTTLTVTAAVLVSVAATPANPSLPLGLTQQFTATGTFSDSSVQDLTTSVTWSSSDTGKATISNAAGSRGLANSVAVGSTTVTATDPGSGIFGSTTLTVTAAVLVSIAVTPASPSIPLGLTQQFTATGTFSDSSVQDLTTSVTWSSSSTATATISNAAGSHGLATSAAVGSTTITATDPGSSIAGGTTLAVTQIAFVAAATAGADSGVLTLTIATPVGTAAGDVLIASIAVRPNTATITPPAGWTLVNRINNAATNANSLAVYVRVATVGEPANHAWAFSASTGSAGGIAAFRGVDTGNPVDVANGQTTGSGLSHAAPSVTTTTSGAMIVTAHGFASCANWTPPAGMAEALEAASVAPPNGAGISLECNYAIQVAAGATGVKTATASNDVDVGNAHLLALRRAP